MNNSFDLEIYAFVTNDAALYRVTKANGAIGIGPCNDKLKEYSFAY